MKKLLLLSAIATVSIFAGNVSGSLNMQGQLADKGIQDKMFATYGNIKYMDKLGPIAIGANFYAVSDFGLVDMKNQFPGYMKNGDGYTMLNEAYVQGSWNKTNVKAGRFQINEGLLSSGKDKYDYVVPNSFEGISVSRVCGPFSSKFAWIDKMSGRDNFASLDKFNKVESMARDYTGDRTSTVKGAFFGRVAYSNGSLNANVQDLYVNNFSNSFLGEIGYKVNPSVSIFGQVLRNDSDNHVLDTTALGAKAIWNINPQVSAEIAYNHTGDKSIPGFLFGSDPLYTSSIFMNAYNDSNVNAFKVSGDYKISDKVNLKAGYMQSKGDFYKRHSGEVGVKYLVTEKFNVKGVIGHTKENGYKNNLGKVVISYSF